MAQKQAGYLLWAGRLSSIADLLLRATAWAPLAVVLILEMVVQSALGAGLSPTLAGLIQSAYWWIRQAWAL